MWIIPLLTEYVKYVNLVLPSKGSSVPLVSAADEAHCILYYIFREVVLMTAWAIALMSQKGVPFYSCLAT